MILKCGNLICGILILGNLKFKLLNADLIWLSLFPTIVFADPSLLSNADLTESSLPPVNVLIALYSIWNLLNTSHHCCYNAFDSTSGRIIRLLHISQCRLRITQRCVYAGSNRLFYPIKLIFRRCFYRLQFF